LLQNFVSDTKGSSKAVVKKLLRKTCLCRGSSQAIGDDSVRKNFMISIPHQLTSIRGIRSMKKFWRDIANFVQGGENVKDRA